MDSSPNEQVNYVAILHQTRRRRKYFFASVLIYIPVLYLTLKILPTNKAMGTVFGIWFVLLVVVTFLVALCKCPRCGNYFHLHGMTLLILRKCLHCQLHISSDVIPETCTDT